MQRLKSCWHNEIVYIINILDFLCSRIIIAFAHLNERDRKSICHGNKLLTPLGEPQIESVRSGNKCRICAGVKETLKHMA